MAAENKKTEKTEKAFQKLKAKVEENGGGIDEDEKPEEQEAPKVSKTDLL